ncbi:MAG TPA: HlyD family type I secretion periplasmic adaptor subunit, partial [Gammaproteobacteria bacterium]|nr:HlyD family type I secretion periplasmic adaptor subunit [Gammaproteobacteria bacterium]
HLEGGLIAEILVDDGDAVTLGQPLVVLQQTQARAAFEVLEGERRLLAARQARLLAEQRGLDAIRFPDWLLQAADEDPEIQELVTSQLDLFATRREVHEGRKAIGRKRIDELQEEIRGLQSQIGNQHHQLDLLDEEVSMKRNLVDTGLLPRPELLALERMKAEIQTDVAENSTGIARANQSIGETELQVVNEDSRRLDDIVNELSETRSQLASVEERLFAQRDVLERTVVTAPVGGTIVQKRFFTSGGVVGPGQPILDIVPQDTELLIDARVRPVDIDELAVGQQARVHFLSLVERRLPQIHGIVRRVSADSLVDEITAESYYLAQVEVPPEEIHKLGEGTRITPGMPVEVLIVTGERTFLEYLAQPLLDSLRRSFREQ